MAIAAAAMAALSRGLSLSPGAIHVAQEVEFASSVEVGETLTSYARVSRKQNRGRFHLLAIELDVCRGDGGTVLRGRTSFILPGHSQNAARQ